MREVLAEQWQCVAESAGLSLNQRCQLASKDAPRTSLRYGRSHSDHASIVETTLACLDLCLTDVLE